VSSGGGPTRAGRWLATSDHVASIGRLPTSVLLTCYAFNELLSRHHAFAGFGHAQKAQLDLMVLGKKQSMLRRMLMKLALWPPCDATFGQWRRLSAWRVRTEVRCKTGVRCGTPRLPALPDRDGVRPRMPFIPDTFPVIRRRTFVGPLELRSPGRRRGEDDQSRR
jgi:hypothetical protein